MEEKRSSLAPIAVGVLALLLAAVPFYVGCYLWRGEAFLIDDPDGSRTILRHYPSRLEYRLFSPAGKIEELITGNTVEISPPMKTMLE
jgi:hypothetical protein